MYIVPVVLTILNYFRFLKFYEEELGEIASTVIPPVLKKYPNVSSQYGNVTFSIKTATRKKGVDLMSVGHPLMNASIAYYILIK